MLKIVLALVLVLPQAAFSAENQSRWPGAMELAQSGDVIIRSGQQGSTQSRERRTRYYCQLDNGGGCPQSAGRVGERCRCSNQTGGGRLIAY
ncbi:hypothetical protein [Rhizobium sp. RU36D]|uniref:hypothetical protein n=1 Tax=Rhizobium sp. RU36D TaxID=1907415 RepID=UPI0009D86D9A|nr:hypothetical protein [Rhizobium sp. RU36D]SMC91890.1 hypothetical protein SAMN05880593_11093 [Rhizobium sp. RU36D]